MGVVCPYFFALVGCRVALIDITNGVASVWPASGLLFGVLLLTPEPASALDPGRRIDRRGDRGESWRRVSRCDEHRLHMHQPR